MLCIYRSKANFAENMANNVKKRVKVQKETEWQNTTNLAKREKKRPLHIS